MHREELEESCSKRISHTHTCSHAHTLVRSTVIPVPQNHSCAQGTVCDGFPPRSLGRTADSRPDVT
ncbi:hypothetical protein AAFF_G00040240, partial [Aldrovandia affinis]